MVQVVDLSGRIRSTSSVARPCNRNLSSSTFIVCAFRCFSCPLRFHTNMLGVQEGQEAMLVLRTLAQALMQSMQSQNAAASDQRSWGDLNLLGALWVLHADEVHSSAPKSAPSISPVGMARIGIATDPKKAFLLLKKSASMTLKGRLKVNYKRTYINKGEVSSFFNVVSLCHLPYAWSNYFRHTSLATINCAEYVVYGQWMIILWIYPLPGMQSSPPPGWHETCLGSGIPSKTFICHYLYCGEGCQPEISPQSAGKKI